jgi:hypothetical protein
VDAPVVDAGDANMVQPAKDRDLAPESIGRLRVRRRQRRVDQLHDRGATGLGVSGEVSDAHAAGADSIRQHVFADRRADEVRSPFCREPPVQSGQRNNRQVLRTIEALGQRA